MRKIFFVSSRFPFHLVIYPGSGPEFAAAYDWPVQPLDTIASADCDMAVVENRLDVEDIAPLEVFLNAKSRRFPVFFKLSDPTMPRSRNPGVRYILGKADAPGVHYLSVYRPAGPLADFVSTLRRSRVAIAPFAYEPSREVAVAFAERRRRIFLSGARSRRLYPLRESLNRRVAWNPLVRRLVDRLPHPGYPDVGERKRHDVVRDRYVQRAARSTHFFLDPSRYGVELMKYLECAYAGSVPFGAPALSLRSLSGADFAESQCRTRDMRMAIGMPLDEMDAIASTYRAAMGAARDPRRLDAHLDDQVGVLV